jgi:transcription antitermination factor NusA-like protein
MTTLTIQISDKVRDLFEKLAKRLNVKIIKVVEEDEQPNSLTKRAIADARSGKIKKMENVDLFFKSL